MQRNRWAGVNEALSLPAGPHGWIHSWIPQILFNCESEMLKHCQRRRARCSEVVAPRIVEISIKQVEASSKKTELDTFYQLRGLKRRTTQPARLNFLCLICTGGERARTEAKGEAAQDVCLCRKDFNLGHQPGLPRLPGWNFGIVQKSKAHVPFWNLSRDE